MRNYEETSWNPYSLDMGTYLEEASTTPQAQLSDLEQSVATAA